MTEDGRVRLHVEDSGGSGRPVVLIHGWPLSGAAWEHQVGPLAEAGHRVVTYDRRGFGRSEKPSDGYDYDTLAADLDGILADLDLRDATLVGFSMGGGEVARYVANHGEDRLGGVVFAAAVPPFMMQRPDNPDGPLTEDVAQQMEAGIRADRDGFFQGFMRTFFQANGEVAVSDEEVAKAVALCRQAGEAAVFGCMNAFGTTDFRDDLEKITVPTLVLHGDADAIVPLEGSGARTHAAVDGAELVVIEGGPHGLNVSHADAFNRALLDFLAR